MSIQPLYQLVNKIPYNEGTASYVLYDNIGMKITLGKVEAPGWNEVIVFEASFINGTKVVYINSIYYEVDKYAYCTSTSEYSPERELLLSHVAYMCGGKMGDIGVTKPPKYSPLPPNIGRVKSFPNALISASDITSHNFDSNIIEDSVSELKTYFARYHRRHKVYSSDKVKKTSFLGKTAYVWKYFYDENVNHVDVIVTLDVLAPQGMVVYVATINNETEIYDDFSTLIVEKLCKGYYGDKVYEESINDDDDEKEDLSNSLISSIEKIADVDSQIEKLKSLLSSLTKLYDM